MLNIAILYMFILSFLYLRLFVMLYNILKYEEYFIYYSIYHSCIIAYIWFLLYVNDIGMGSAAERCMER